jgi:hypothetical protein
MYGTTAQINITDNWFHDYADSNTVVCDSTCNAHQNGPGYLNSGTGPSNVLVKHNTITTISNGNVISFFSGTGGLNNVSIINNYLSGAGYAVIMTSLTNVTFTDNIFGTDLPWEFGPLYAGDNYVTKFHTAGNTWRRNTINIRPGTAPHSGSTLAWTNGQNGYFMLPHSTLSTTDFV